MKIALVITYLSVFFWLFPPFRQYKERFFIYFLIMAIMDPINLLYVQVLGGKNLIVFTIGSILLFYSINFSLNILKKFWYVNVLFIALIILFFLYIPNLRLLIILLHLLIFIKFFKIGVITLHKYNSVNIFLLALIFYELSIIINELVFLSNYNIKVIFFYTTIFFQILIAIFFTIFKEDNPRLNIKLKTIPQSSAN